MFLGMFAGLRKPGDGYDVLAIAHAAGSGPAGLPPEKVEVDRGKLPTRQV